MSEPREKDDYHRFKPTPARIAIWVIVGGVGLYFLIAGITGIVTAP